MWKMRENTLSQIYPRSVSLGCVPRNGRRLFLEIFLKDEILVWGCVALDEVRCKCRVDFFFFLGREQVGYKTM